MCSRLAFLADLLNILELLSLSLFKGGRGGGSPKNKDKDKEPTNKELSYFDDLPLRDLVLMFKGKGIAKATSYSRFSLGISLRFY